LGKCSHLIIGYDNNLFLQSKSRFFILGVNVFTPMSYKVVLSTSYTVSLGETGRGYIPWRAPQPLVVSSCVRPSPSLQAPCFRARWAWWACGTFAAAPDTRQ